MSDLLFAAIFTAVMCAILAAEPLWNVIWKRLHRGDQIDHPAGKRRL